MKKISKFFKILFNKFSPLICENQHFLNKLILSGRSRKKLSLIIQQATNSELLCLVECCLNLLKGRLPLKNRQLSMMRKQSQVLRKLAKARSASSAKSLLLKGIGQNGDGLPLVPSLLASIILPLITETIMSKFNEKHK